MSFCSLNLLQKLIQFFHKVFKVFIEENRENISSLVESSHCSNHSNLRFSQMQYFFLSKISSVCRTQLLRIILIVQYTVEKLESIFHLNQTIPQIQVPLQIRDWQVRFDRCTPTFGSNFCLGINVQCYLQYILGNRYLTTQDRSIRNWQRCSYQ